MAGHSAGFSRSHHQGLCLPLDEGCLDEGAEPWACDNLQGEGDNPRLHQTADGIAVPTLELC